MERERKREMSATKVAHEVGYANARSYDASLCGRGPVTASEWLYQSAPELLAGCHAISSAYLRCYCSCSPNLDPYRQAEGLSGRNVDPSVRSEDLSGRSEDPFGRTEDPSGQIVDPFGRTADPSGRTEGHSGRTVDPSDWIVLATGVCYGSNSGLHVVSAGFDGCQEWPAPWAPASVPSLEAPPHRPHRPTQL